MTVTVHHGDCREVLRALPDDSVHCVVTSPPYWGLRDYGVAGQMGLEPTLGEHIDAMVAVFEEVQRVLRRDGTCWINYGDAYANDGKWGGSTGGKHAGGLHGKTGIGRQKRVTGLKPKDLCMVSNRLAIALQDAGWWVRSEIIWHKPNPMPESVTDRPAVAHEKVWLLSKSARYWYDAESVRREAKGRGRRGRQSYGRHTLGEAIPSDQRRDKQRGHGRRHAGFNERWDAMPVEEQMANGANLRNVWTIPAKGFPGAHFATFPPDLAELCIRAGCPEGGVVLDPFAGAGTTGMVANLLNRDAILIELNPDYLAMAERRIADSAGMFGKVVRAT